MNINLDKIVEQAFNNELEKIAIFKEGKRYPSKEMKKEFDTDGPPPDLDSATDYSPKYPTDHLSIKTAAMVPNRFLVNKILSRRYISPTSGKWANKVMEGQHYLEAGKHYAETTDEQDDQQNRAKFSSTNFTRFLK